MGKLNVMNLGVYTNLIEQLDKVFRHVNQGSCDTRDRYYEATDRLCKFVADEFKLQKLVNLQPKHIEAYVKHLMERGTAAGTIKTDLSGIRFIYDQSGGKHKLPTNAELGVERRSFGGVYRAWTDEEYTGALLVSYESGDYIVYGALQLSRTLGLRIHEIVRLNHVQIVKALRYGVLRNVKGKGGKLRDIPLTEASRAALNLVVERSEWGRKAFVPQGEQAHRVIKHIQNWIDYNRDKFSGRKVTIHGLRHRYAQEEYEKALKRFGNERMARLDVSRKLGHERDEVTRIYLVGEDDTDKSI